MSMAQAVSTLSEHVRETIVDTEARTLCIVGMVAHQLEKEIEAAVVSTAVTSKRNTLSVVDTLREEIRAHLSQNRADFEHRQDETKQTVAKVSADLETLTKQLNLLNP